MGNRRRGRECALQLMYYLEFEEVAEPEALNLAMIEYWESFSNEGKPVSEEVRNFATALVRGVLAREPEIDEAIRQASTNWKLERMARVDRNILRIATYELKFAEDIPPRVSLNEAIEIAKRYGSEDSSSFINGILDRVSQSV